MKRERPETAGSSAGGGAHTAPEMVRLGKGKFKLGMEDDDGVVDELLAALGYKVRSSDMADVAQKLEQLEMAMGGGAVALAAVAPTVNDDPSFAIAHLGCDTVHYNPSDLSTWLDSMLTELNAPPPPLPVPPVAMQNHRGFFPQQSHFDLPPPLAEDPSLIAGVIDFPPIVHRPSIDGVYDLNPIPVASGDRLLYGSPDPQSEIVSRRDRKRTRTTTTCSSSSSSSRGAVIGGGGIMGGGGAGSSTAEVASSITTGTSSPSAPLPVVMLDTQEAGIRLIHALMACAEAVQQENFKAADILVKQIPVLAASQGGAMRKVAGYFAEALARRIYGLHPQADFSLLDAVFADLLQAHFYESCPYLKFAHFTANQAILEAFAGCRRVHVIDFGMKQGMQWPALLQALALRPGGPPSFRLTGIGPPQPDNSDALQQVGWKLAQLADTIHVDFRYRGFVANTLADLEPYMLLESADSTDDDKTSEPEAVAVNSVFELHQLLARPGALEKVLGTVRAVRPRIVTVVEQEANHNTGSFQERFTEALHYYSTIFDSLEGGASGGGEQQQDQVLSEVYLGREIGNVVACEGTERTERHETLTKWRGRMARAGFEPVHLGSNAFKQASMLLALYAGGDGYRVEEKEGCLTLGWHNRPLIATSAWRVTAAPAPAAAAAAAF